VLASGTGGVVVGVADNVSASLGVTGAVAPMFDDEVTVVDITESDTTL
jgi:2-phospho-L-lactate transferase/gluconeogenesis factor (CofD/UPF0052 family)